MKIQCSLNYINLRQIIKPSVKLNYTRYNWVDTEKWALCTY